MTPHRVSPSEGWGDPPTNQKTGSPPMSPHTVLPKYVNFVISMQFLAILTKMSPTSRTQLRKPATIALAVLVSS